MKFSNAKRIIVILVLVATFFTSTTPRPAQGFFGVFDWMNGLIQGIGHSIQGTLLGVDATANTVTAGLETTELVFDGIPLTYTAYQKALAAGVTACEVSDGGFVINLVDDLASSVAGIGDQTKATATLFIGRRLAMLNVKKACYFALSKSYKAAMVSFDEQIKQAFVDVLKEIDAKQAPIEIQITELQDQQKTAVQDIFKAIAAGVVISINEQYTANAINEMKPKLALGSYGKTIDALTSQVYAVEYIKKNYSGDLGKQLIMTSLLDSELIPDGPGKVQALGTVKVLIDARLKANGCAQDYEMSSYDINTIMKASQSVSNECNVQNQMNAFQQELSGVLLQSRSSAQLEVSNGNGFQSTRSCRDVTSQETQIRTTSSEATRKYALATRNVTILEKEKITGAPYVEAVNAANKAREELNLVPQKVGGGIVAACGLINDPGAFVAGRLNNLVDNWVQSTSNVRNNDPLAAMLAKALTKKIFKGIILNPKDSHEVLSELGSSALNATLTGAVNNAGSLIYPTANTIPINPSDISGGNANLDTGTISAYITPKGQTTKIDKLTPGQEYDIVVDISKVNAKFSTDPVLFNTDDKVRDCRKKDELRPGDPGDEPITAGDRQRGNFRIGFTANNSSGTFTISVCGRIAPNPTKRLGTTTVNYSPVQSGTVSGAVTIVPEDANFYPRGLPVY